MNKLSTLKTLWKISALIATCFVIMSLMTFHLIDFKPLLRLNDWVLAHLIDNQKNKLALFYLMHGSIFINITGVLKHFIDKQTKTPQIDFNNRENHDPNRKNRATDARRC